MTETQVGELLERATAELRTTTDLVAGGIAAGRRRRRHSLALAAAGTLAAVGVVSGALVSSSGGGAGDDTLVADPSSSTGTSSYAAQPSTSVAPQVDPADHGPFPLPPDAMATTLGSLLHGAVTNPQDSQQHPATPDGSQSGAVDLDGATVSVAFQHSEGPRCDGDLGLSSCTPLGDGFLGTYTAEIVEKGIGHTGARGVGVTFYTPDGLKISVTAMNAGSADPTKPVMTDPVLGQAALTAIAQNPVWRGQ
jgi:hypothetical protein